MHLYNGLLLSILRQMQFMCVFGGDLGWPAWERLVQVKDHADYEFLVVIRQPTQEVFFFLGKFSTVILGLTSEHLHLSRDLPESIRSSISHIEILYFQ